MRKFIAKILRWQSKKYLKKHQPKVVVIAGSVGKTSTTNAIATILSEEFELRSTIANYNTDLGVPASIFGQRLPSNVKNPLSWIWFIKVNFMKLYFGRGYKMLVLELGTDKPGEIEEFSWLNPEIAVIVAIAPEHMENFEDLEAVAMEELAVASYSDKLFINKNSVDTKYLEFSENDQIFNYSSSDLKTLNLGKSDIKVHGEHSLEALAAGLAVAKDLGMKEESIKSGIRKINPAKGRMNLLSGVKNSVLVDDTYNSSPEAVYAAIDYISDYKAPQRIVLLGNMNELGEISAAEHSNIGEYCKGNRIDLVVTLGPDANKHSAPAAKKAGCEVKTSTSPYQAAGIIKKHLKDGAIILLKGSQNKVFAEEATKMLLANAEDEGELVRQSAFWMKKKKQNFGDM